MTDQIIRNGWNMNGPTDQNGHSDARIEHTQLFPEEK